MRVTVAGWHPPAGNRRASVTVLRMTCCHESDRDPRVTRTAGRYRVVTPRQPQRPQPLRHAGRAQGQSRPPSTICDFLSPRARARNSKLRRLGLGCQRCRPSTCPRVERQRAPGELGAVRSATLSLLRPSATLPGPGRRDPHPSSRRRAACAGARRGRRQGFAGGQERPRTRRGAGSCPRFKFAEPGRRGRLAVICRRGRSVPRPRQSPPSARGRRHGAPLPGVDRARRRTGPAHGRASSTQPGGALLAPRSAEPMMRPTLVGIHHVQLQK